MLVVLTILSLIFRCGNCEGLTFLKYSDPQPQLESCVGNVMRKYFTDAKMLSYVSDLENDKLLDYVHSLNILSVVIKRFTEYSTTFANRAYMIVARNKDEFTEHVVVISREGNWNPYVRFLIVIDTLQDIDLEKVFNSLLQLHIYNVVVVNGTESAELYIYNPFENYACGKYYDRITKFGKCSNVDSIDLYPDKVVTGLRNCILTVSCTHWPPYSINPAKSVGKQLLIGVEQYVFDLMSQIEQFKYNFVYNYEPETFSTVYPNMSVSGPMTMLQTNHADVILGGLVLTEPRAKKFFYVHGYLDQLDEIKIIVKKSSTTPPWKNFYLEFTPFVWLLLLLVFIFYAIILIVLLRTQDKGRVVLVLLDYLFLHGVKFHGRKMVKIVFISWVWFAYLINCFYQTSLMSLTTKPNTEYQIHDEQSLKAYGLEACVSTLMHKMIISYSNLTMGSVEEKSKSCEKLIQSIKTVSQSKDMYTVTLYSIYLYYGHQFYDEYGRPPVYLFTRPYAKVIYAMYFYKGFPMGERFHEVALRIWEAGLSDRNMKDLFNQRKMKYRFHTLKFESRFAIPWYVFICGICVSCLTFLLEIATLKNKKLLK